MHKKPFVDLSKKYYPLIRFPPALFFEVSYSIVLKTGSSNSILKLQVLRRFRFYIFFLRKHFIFIFLSPMMQLCWNFYDRYSPALATITHHISGKISGRTQRLFKWPQPVLLLIIQEQNTMHVDRNPRIRFLITVCTASQIRQERVKHPH